jgi:GT2 family glycosyltransferase
VFAFGCVLSSEEQYENYARPGIELAGGPDPWVILRRDQTCIFSAYNSILEEACARADAEEGLEGVILLHQDLTIADDRVLDTLRRSFAAPDVGIVGVVGGTGVRGMGWWFSDERYGAYGWDWLLDPEREELFDPASFWSANTVREADVEAVDGMFMAFSPGAARSLRFDETLRPGFHGYDTDICFEARKAGWRVRVEEIDIVHHNLSDLEDREHFIDAHVAFGAKWGL